MKENQVLASVNANGINEKTEYINGLAIRYGVDFFSGNIVNVKIDAYGIITDAKLGRELNAGDFDPETIQSICMEYAEKVSREHIVCDNRYIASDGFGYKIVHRDGGFYAKHPNGKLYEIHPKSWEPACRVLPKPNVSIADYIKYGDDFVWFTIDGENFITISPKDIIG